MSAGVNSSVLPMSASASATISPSFSASPSVSPTPLPNCNQTPLSSNSFTQNDANLRPHSSCLSRPSPINSVLAAMQRTHDRYMRNSNVSQWLLERDAHSDFHAIRPETSVLVSTAPTAPPHLTPTSTLNLSFPASNDLYFLETTYASFALGHVRNFVIASSPLLL